MELVDCLWYPNEAYQAEGYGCDEYKVGNTVGLGGINLRDGENVVKLKATKGREAKVTKGKKGASAELLAKGVICKGDTVDILVRITILNHVRYAMI